MANDIEELEGPNAWKIRGIDALKFVALTSDMIGSFFREVGALVFIFVPLELWDKQQVPAHSALIQYTVVATFVCLTFGFGFAYLAAIANRFKKDMEGNSGNK